MQNRFVVLIDFSEYSDALLRYASEWSQQIGAELLVVHQTSPLIPAFTERADKIALNKEARQDALGRLKAMAEKVIPSGTRIRYHVSERDLLLTLPELLDEAGFRNLIFMGLKGTGVLKKIFIGSVVIDVMENVNNIVVAIPRKISRFSHTDMYVGVSDKFSFDTTRFDQLLEFFGAGLRAITFFFLSGQGDAPEAAEQNVARLRDRYADRYETRYELIAETVAVESIKQVVRQRHKHLLVLQKGSRLLSDQVFRRLLINELIYDGEIPLIILP